MAIKGQRGDSDRLYAVIQPPLTLNIDDMPTNLAEGEMADMDYFIETDKQLYPVIIQPGNDVASGTERPVSCYALSFTGASVADINVVFTTTKMFYKTGNGFSGAYTEVTAGGGATAISVDAGNNKNHYTIAVINNILYFGHDGLGPLRKWDPTAPANYLDVAAPTAGWHNAVKFKPRYLCAHNNRLLIGGDNTAAGGPNDFAWSVSGSPEQFNETGAGFGSGHVSIVDTTEAITGLSLLNNRVIVYKRDSIVLGTPTGDAVTPYNFERYIQGAQVSSGLFAPYSLCGNGIVDYLLTRNGFGTFDGATLRLFPSGWSRTVLADINGSPADAMGAIGGGYLARDDEFVLITPNAGVTGGAKRGYIINTRTGSSSRLTTMAANEVTCVGTLWSVATGSGGQRALAIGSNVATGSSLQLMGITISPDAATYIQRDTLFPFLRIPASIFGPGYLMKSLYRIGFEVIAPEDINQPAFVISLAIDTEQGDGAFSSAPTIYPATNPNIVSPKFTWVDCRLTARLPSITVTYPQGDGSTARYYPRIGRIVVEYSLGDDR